MGDLPCDLSNGDAAIGDSVEVGGGNNRDTHWVRIRSSFSAALGGILSMSLVLVWGRRPPAIFPRSRNAQIQHLTAGERDVCHPLGRARSKISHAWELLCTSQTTFLFLEWVFTRGTNYRINRGVKWCRITGYGGS